MARYIWQTLSIVIIPSTIYQMAIDIILFSGKSVVYGHGCYGYLRFSEIILDITVG